MTRRRRRVRQRLPVCDRRCRRWLGPARSPSHADGAPGILALRASGLFPLLLLALSLGLSDPAAAAFRTAGRVRLSRPLAPSTTPPPSVAPDLPKSSPGRIPLPAPADPVPADASPLSTEAAPPTTSTSSAATSTAAAATSTAAAVATTDPGDPSLPARPPTPGPEGLRTPDLIPVEDRGPAIPVPVPSEIDWGGGSGDGEPVEDVEYSRILGQVVDQATGEPVGDAQVSFPELDMRALTDKDGWFMIQGIPVRPEAYEVLLEAPGYHTGFESLEFPEPRAMRRTLELEPLGW